MKDLTPVLRSLGLMESEIKTYLVAFEQGAGTVLDFTKLTRLSRQATYVAIQGLTKRGLMSSVLHGKKRLYSAEHPDKLLAYAKRREVEMKERIHDLERTLPELELQMGGERPAVKYYEGKEGVRAVIADIQMTKPSDAFEIADLAALRKVLNEQDLEPMRATLKAVGTHVRGIYSGEPITKTTPHERYFIPEKYAGFKSVITIYNNRTSIITFEGKMHSIIIENDALVKCLRVLFDLAFRGAFDFPKK
ncbi:MAG: hypothetical protein Q8R07_01620 [Candidatus Uhrbacteria bacterium]|nr:hypothetical protein [Candidatus Uhrbacteria bacterium]